MKSPIRRFASSFFIFTLLLTPLGQTTSTVAVGANPIGVLPGETPTAPTDGGSTCYLPLLMTTLQPPVMVFIPAGTFKMGCDLLHNDGWDCPTSELPLHAVFLEAYYIDKYEVTNAQHARCVMAGVCASPALNSSFTRAAYYNDPTYSNYPVVWVSWYNANDYCQWAGKRLPSEAEWERAARSSIDSSLTQAYPWGDQHPNCTLANYFDYYGTGKYCEGDTSQVGDYSVGASSYAVLDMAGNVWEWVNDWYQADYYNISPPNNPPGPASGVNKVMRGASWGNFWWDLLSAHRYYYNPQNSDYSIGFRCAVSPVN